MASSDHNLHENSNVLKRIVSSSIQLNCNKITFWNWFQVGFDSSPIHLWWWRPECLEESIFSNNST
jgi:hypothetical protein